MCEWGDLSGSPVTLDWIKSSLKMSEFINPGTLIRVKVERCSRAVLNSWLSDAIRRFYRSKRKKENFFGRFISWCKTTRSWVRSGF